ncbi:hypothetical protein LCGC14_1810740 [marine sediment metagenome]|uniref:Uncharacterized protein n=1 Tax=marine sediment metagenome TaxID=412755 RepID=A0A0F9JLK5_9ZZZZ
MKQHTDLRSPSRSTKQCCGPAAGWRCVLPSDRVNPRPRRRARCRPGVVSIWFVLLARLSHCVSILTIFAAFFERKCLWCRSTTFADGCSEDLPP